MDQTPWYLNSVTIRAAVVTLLPVLALIAKAFGASLGTEEQSQMIDGIVAIVGLIGTICVFIARTRAQREIEKTKG